MQHKFNINDKVYSCYVSWIESKVTCPDCLGTKEWTVTLPSGEVFKHECCTCRAGWYCTGLVSEWGDKAQINQVTIGSIQIDTASETPIRYMCVETGVGSGRVYDEKHLFHTREQAEEWGAIELERVRGVRQAQELQSRKHKKGDSLIHGKRAKKR